MMASPFRSSFASSLPLPFEDIFHQVDFELEGNITSLFGESYNFMSIQRFSNRWVGRSGT